MWMRIKAWDHKKQTQKMSPVILSEAKDPCNPNRVHCVGKEFFRFDFSHDEQKQ
jgi:hypothetical protein